MPDSDENSALLGQSFIDQPHGLFRGPNSLHNFASSFVRAQLFAAQKLDPAIHKKRSFFDANDDELFDPDLMVPSVRGERLSTILHDMGSFRANQAFANSTLPYNEVFYQDDVANALRHTRSNQSMAEGIPIPTRGRKSYPLQSFLSIRLSISYASTASHFGLKKVEDKDGNVVTVVAGQSTAPQTVFNSVNVMIGVGLLALPVGLLKAGWVLGFPLLVACCLSTGWTASLLSKIMDRDNTLMTFADLGYMSYGSTAKLLISLIFSIDLLGAGVSLVVLFSDSLYALVGSEFWTKTRFKLLAFVVLTPFTFVPLLVLSIVSLMGIMSTITITLLVVICGLVKQTLPGSLIQVMPTNLWPESIPLLLAALGILMAPFGGHAIFPNLKTDMRHPQKFTSTLIPTYAITLFTDSTMAVVGFFMFGAMCSNELTSVLLETQGYPSFIYPLISALICIVPLAKTPLNAKPIISTLDGIFGLDTYVGGQSTLADWTKTVGRILTRVGVNALFVGFAILFPEFDKVIGIMGSSISFLVCFILPCLFYLKLCGDNVGPVARLGFYAIISVCLVLAALCTYVTISY